jgi:hypothetical protein
MERSRELEEFVMAWFGAASRGEPALVHAHVSLGDGTRLIGSAPDEVFKGGSAVAEFLSGEVEGAGGNVTFSPSDTEAFSEGTVGWATTKIMITMPDGGHVSPRWSAVFHMEDGVWKFVQTHASIGIANEDVGWTYSD